MENWVDFKAVKAAVSMEEVLNHYQVNWLRKSGDELRGRCPIHQGEGTDTFHVNVLKNAFQCFAGSCKKRGNVLDLVAAMARALGLICCQTWPSGSTRWLGRSSPARR